MLITIQKGLGDAIYAQPVIRELAKNNEITLETEFTDLYSNIENVTLIKNPLDEQIRSSFRLHWYTNYPNAFDQLCKIAKVGELDFNIKVETVPTLSFETDKPLCIVKAPYNPQYLSKMSINYKSFAGSVEEIQQFINDNQKEFYFICTGVKTDYTAKLKNIDSDLNEKLTLLQFLALCKKADTFVSQIGHLLAIACAFKKKIKIVSSNKDNPKMYTNRLNAVVIPNTCILI